MNNEEDINLDDAQNSEEGEVYASSQGMFDGGDEEVTNIESMSFNDLLKKHKENTTLEY